MKTRAKGKELMKVVAVCVLSIGLFSAAFFGFNQLIFASATNEPTPLSKLPSVSADYTGASGGQAAINAYTVIFERADFTNASGGQATEHEEDVYVVPSLTVAETPYQHFTIPAVAMSMEEAAQIGARYIWDVFGASIDGMHVEMLFGAWPSQSRTYWQGIVRAEAFDLESARYNREARTAVNDAILYRFSIDAVTGMRVDITSSYLRSLPLEELQNRALDERHAMIEVNWWEMDAEQQFTFLGVDVDDIAEYIEKAQLLAGAHFGAEGLSGSLSNIRVQLGNNGLEPAAIEYVVTYGDREAIIIVPTSAAHVGWYSLSTSQNDFIPGYQFHDDGSGLG